MTTLQEMKSKRLNNPGIYRIPNLSYEAWFRAFFYVDTRQIVNVCITYTKHKMDLLPLKALSEKAF